MAKLNKIIRAEKSEAKIKEEYEQMKIILSSIGEGLIVIDKNHRIILLNKAGRNILKITQKEALGKNVKKILTILKNKNKIVSKDWPTNKVLKTGKTIKIGIKDNFYFKIGAEKTFPVELILEPLAKGGVIGTAIVFKDITEDKLREEEREFSKYNLQNVLKSVYIERDNVQEEKNKLEATLNGIGDAVLAVDEEKRVIIFNPAAEKIAGIALGEMEGRAFDRFLKLVDETTNEDKTNIVKTILEGEKKIITDYNTALIVAKNKRSISVDISAAPIKDHHGEIMGCIVVFRDVSEKREMERMRSDFISIVSHQLRTPLSAMKWLLEILLSNDVGELKPDQMDVIKEVHTSNQNMIDFVNQLLNVSRIESNHLAINPEKISLDETVREIIKEIEVFIREKSQKLSYINHINKDLQIKTDKSLLRNIINSLLINASRYTPSEGNITLEITKKNKDFLLFKVSDTGIGIPEKETYKIFRKFSRASNAIKYEASGTGLGLYIVKSILDIMGGKVWFVSRENEGSAFFFILPIESVFCEVHPSKSGGK